MRRNRRVKIVATLGPASSSPEVLERLFLAGVDVFRINMSHSSHEMARTLARTVRDVGAKHRHPIGILCDLQGPKFRLGEFHGESARRQGRRDLPLRPDAVAGIVAARLSAASADLRSRRAGAHAADRRRQGAHARHRAQEPRAIAAEVVTGGQLSSRKGVSLPDTVLPISPLTDKDRADLDWALTIGADWIALSFVQRAEDVIEAKRIIDGRAAVLRQDREAFGDRRSRRHHRRRRRLHGGARRSRCRNAGRARARPAEADHAQGRARRQADRRRDADARKHDLVADADARRGLRRRHRRVRRRRRHHAFGESAVGQFPVETIQMMDRIAIEVENDPSYDAFVHATEQSAAADRRRRDRRRGARHRGHGQGRGDPLLHGDRLDGAARRARASAICP